MDWLKQNVPLLAFAYEMSKFAMRLVVKGIVGLYVML